MEENKKKKISISTVLLILAIIGMGVMGYFIYKLNDDKVKAENDVNGLNEKINTLENTVNSLQENNDTKSNNTSNTTNGTKNNSNSKTEISEIKSLIKNESDHERLQIVSAKEEDGKYLVKANFYTPVVYSEKDYSNMVKNKKIVLNNKEYVYSNTDKDRNFKGYGYVYIEGENIEGGYWIEKVDDGYIFVNEIGGYWTRIEKVKKTYEFYLDKDVEVDDFLANEIYTLKEFVDDELFSKYTSVVVLDENKIKISADAR